MRRSSKETAGTATGRDRARIEPQRPKSCPEGALRRLVRVGKVDGWAVPVVFFGERVMPWYLVRCPGADDDALAETVLAHVIGSRPRRALRKAFRYDVLPRLLVGEGLTVGFLMHWINETERRLGLVREQLLPHWRVAHPECPCNACSLRRAEEGAG